MPSRGTPDPKSPDATPGSEPTLRFIHETSPTPRFHYYPSVDRREGKTWLAWLEYLPDSQEEQLWLSTPNHGEHLIRDHAPELLSPTCKLIDSRTLWVVWIEGPEFKVMARRYDPSQDRLGEPVRLSPHGVRCNHLTVHPDRKKLWLCWEAWAADASNSIQTCIWSAKEGWSQPVGLTPEVGSAYWPTFTTTEEHLWLAWSTPNPTGDGYDCKLAVTPKSALGIANTRVYPLNSGYPGNFHLYPNLLRNTDGRVWVSWLASTDQEYYDATPLPGNSDFAYLQDASSRRKRNIWWKASIPVVLQLSLDENGLVRQALPGSSPTGMVEAAGHCHYPTLVPCSRGVPGLLSRGLTPNLLFHTRLSTYGNDGWQDPREIHPPSFQTGRNGPIALSYDGATCSYVCALQGHQVQPGDSFRWAPPTDSLVAVATWSDLEQDSPEQQALFEQPLLAPTAITGETRAPMTRPDRAANIQESRTYFGNIHVHSDLSGCRRDTQQGIDFNYRWAKDLMKQDFHALTDHAEHLSAYDWKWTRTMARFYDFPGHFVAVLAYEWTVNDFGPDPHCGHCNVILRDEAQHAFGSDEPESDSLEKLWSRLSPRRALTIPHHTASYPYLRDWNIHNPTFERLVEVHQDRRGNYEYRGCPGEYGVAAPLQVREKNMDGGYVVDALERGYRLGLVAGGDHMGISMTGLYAGNLTKEAIFQALYERQCYGVTGAAIKLAVTAHSSRQFTPIGMGGELELPADRRLTLNITVEGTAELASIEVITAGRVAASTPTLAATAARETFDLVADQEEHYFYVRIVQKDAEMAWSSPIWLTSSPSPRAEVSEAPSVLGRP